ncbi:MAG: carbohydrate kinase family protein, partial [Gemmatimonadetes bacterium]|nr:carbohydrate kinase family protein [Gemmatimonadota bacterium]
DRIVAVAGAGAERRVEIESLVSHYAAVDASHIRWNPDGTNETVLTYRNEQERDEALLERVPPLDREGLEPVMDADYHLVNFISGKEMSLALWEEFHEARGGFCVADIQSLTLTFGKNKRGHRSLPEWRRWVAPVDVVKGNESEWRWLLGGEKPFAGTLQELASLVLAEGPSTLLITRGGDGHVLAWKEIKHAYYAEIPALPVSDEDFVDSTGCGDVFASGYLLGVMRGEKPLAASLLAGTLASESARLRGIPQLARLADPADLRAASYGRWWKRAQSHWKGERL